MEYLLYESASGYALFEGSKIDQLSEETLASIPDFSSFSKLFQLKSFLPFDSAQNALENINALSEGICTEYLKNFLELNLPKVKGDSKKKKFVLGVGEEKLATSIAEAVGVQTMRTTTIQELLRGIRIHFTKCVKKLSDSDLDKAQLALGHAYSRSKVKFNVNRVDNMIIQSICLLDQLDKDLNTLSMRAREWYSWHFPELVRITSDNYTFARLIKCIRDKSTLSENSVDALEEIVSESQVARDIVNAARASMGTDISEFDLEHVLGFAERIIHLHEYRQRLHAYLVKKMEDCAPNLCALIGELVGARLISHAGSLTNLAKYPASTVQILGAEKALFRALKTRGATPKYGLIFHSSFIGRASQKNKGRISRYLANKCSVATRIDSFSDVPTKAYGLALKDQVEERLSFYESGAIPRKNLDVMQAVTNSLDGGSSGKKKKKKNTTTATASSGEKKSPAPATPSTLSDEKKKKKKKKKKPTSSVSSTPTNTNDGEKKKKRKRSEIELTEQKQSHDSVEKKKKKKKKKVTPA